MGLGNHIENAMKSVLKNPILSTLREIKYQRPSGRKLLLLSSTALIERVETLHRADEPRPLIIDDTGKAKRGKNIEGGCKSIWSNKEGRYTVH